jgi:hypothetical protein
MRGGINIFMMRGGEGVDQLQPLSVAMLLSIPLPRRPPEEEELNNNSNNKNLDPNFPGYWIF